MSVAASNRLMDGLAQVRLPPASPSDRAQTGLHSRLGIAEEALGAWGGVPDVGWMYHAGGWPATMKTRPQHEAVVRSLAFQEILKVARGGHREVE